ncbi:uncharacterized protein LOC108626573, partial [Ceratina calcarata]|uniref:Uncharacterized protein LOC108626573 n=1 Tax=Ceratina calcarata TaxID=156304 RepID=A0AAJ7J2V8_9HYME
MSTVDAISRVKSQIQTYVQENGAAVAISLDIANAFNSLPWCSILDAMEELKFPDYLKEMVTAYLSNRTIMYINAEAKVQERSILCGVPQGSTLAAPLWNVGYNRVLKTPMPPKTQITGYADDTIIVAGGRTIERAINRAEIAVAK